MVLGTNFLAACFELSIFRSITISKRTATASGPRQKEFFGGSLFFSLNFISHLKTVKYPKESPDIPFWRIGGTTERLCILRYQNGTVWNTFTWILALNQTSQGNFLSSWVHSRKSINTCGCYEWLNQSINAASKWLNFKLFLRIGLHCEPHAAENVKNNALMVLFLLAHNSGVFITDQWRNSIPRQGI